MTENKEIVSSDKNTPKILNTFFSNIVASLNIPGYKCNPVAGNTEDPINKSIVKYKNHLSAPALGELCNRAKEFPFAFSLVDWEEILKEIVNLDISKARQNTDS